MHVTVTQHTRDTGRAESTVGTLLRQHRQLAGLDISEVSRALRIRRVYLEAIEAGRYADLPGTPYAIGFVRAYADHLHLNGDRVVRRLREETPLAQLAPRHDGPRTQAESAGPKGIILVIGAVLALAAYGGWYVLSSHDSEVVQLVMPVPKRLENAVGQSSRQEATRQSPAAEREDEPLPAPATQPDAQASDDARSSPDAQPMADTGVATATNAEATEPTSPDTPPIIADNRPTAAGDDLPADDARADDAESSPPPRTAAENAAPEQDPASATHYGAPAPVVLRATADCWIEVRDNTRNRLVFARLLSAGDTYSVVPQPGLTLLAGNAGGIEVIVDGVNRGTLGRQGEVRRNVDLSPQGLKLVVSPGATPTALDGTTRAPHTNGEAPAER